MPAAESPWIISTTDATFTRDVLERSQEVPVVVDFWASWCQPCLMLKPILEKLAEEYAGRFVLVKAESEHNQAAAAQFNVSSIPAVFGLVGGELVDAFGGLAPESNLRNWLDRLIEAGEIQAVTRLADADPIAAEAQYRTLIERHPREASLQIGLARTLLAQQQKEAAATILQQLEARGFLEPEAQKLKAALELASMQGGNLAELEARAAAEPQNLDALLDLARALAGAERHEAALERCLAIIQAQKSGPGEQAKQLMLDIFRVLPNDSELTGVYRRRLTSLLY